MSNKDMKSHLPNVDLDKIKAVINIKEAYNNNEISLKEARVKLKNIVSKLEPYEIALAEQELKTYDKYECQKENIQQMLDLFDGIINFSRPVLADDHPIAYYYKENDEMRKLLSAIEDLVQYPLIKNQWLEIYDSLSQFKLHLARKQNQLYSILEKKGFDRPTTTMWLLDDFVRDEIKAARTLLENDKDEEFIAMQSTIIADVKDLMKKEEYVLYPTSLAMINDDEFEDMKSGDREIGFAWIDVKDRYKAKELKKETNNNFATELASLLGKYGFSSDTKEQVFDVSTGKLKLEQINLIFKHLPIDISFVDENELVCFYSDTDHRIFPRSKNVIGRDVKNCHPRTSVHLVEEIIEKFRSGEQDSVDFWINKPGLFIYIYYVAVRDSQGNFRGVLEMMQDATRIRDLEGSQTLLSWSNSTDGKSKNKEGEPISESVYKESVNHDTNSEEYIDENTKLKYLLDKYPSLKDRLPSINSAFKMLKSPLARIIIPRADVKMMSERSEMPLDELIKKLKELIKEIK